MASTDDERPETLTVEQIGEDLSLSNLEGTSWFGYAWLESKPDALVVEMYGDDGEILKTYEVTMTIKESI